MDLDEETCYRAVRSRDRRFAGRFVLAVQTTGVYCRPGCPAPLPKRENSRFYPCPAAAEEAGFRPCLRCRPDAAPGTPVWSGTSATVSRALRLVLDGGLDGTSVEQLAGRVGVGSRHLRRLFLAELGATPSAIARTRRVHFARRLLDETALPIRHIADEAGFSSVRTFNEAMHATFRKEPRELRRELRSDGRRRSGWPLADPPPIELRLPFRPPLDWVALTAFLGARALPGVEAVEDGIYRRTLALPDGASPPVTGVLSVAPVMGESHVALSLRLSAPRQLLPIVRRMNALFDLGADPLAIAGVLGNDALLAPLVVARPGLRVPGAFSAFELAARAVLGQQVSVKAARTLAGRLVAAFGTPLATRVAGLTHLFPEPQKLLRADLTGIGLTRARAETLRVLARSFRDGTFPEGDALGLPQLVTRLTSLPGIGPWTAHYIAMRAFREPDAFPEGDLVLRRAAAGGADPLSPAALSSRAGAWRPFRSYAAVHLWTAASSGGQP